MTRQIEKQTATRGKVKSNGDASKHPTTTPKKAAATKPDSSELDEQEQRLLVKYEDQIRSGLSNFVQMGSALEEIKAKKLHRVAFPDFQEYCKSVWDIDKSYANRLVKGGACVRNLQSAPIGAILLPATESQARVIAQLPSQDQILVATKAKELAGDKPASAAIFQQAKDSVFPRKIEQKQKAEKESNPEELVTKTLTLRQDPKLNLLTLQEILDMIDGMVKRRGSFEDLETEVVEAIKIVRFFADQAYPPEVED
jgi:hypothetical protein